jgi:hypothetical protein
MDIEIRRATLEDIPWLLDRLQRFDKHYAAAYSLFDEAYTRDEFLPGIINHHLFLIAEHQTAGPVGFLAGLITPHILNPKLKTLAELLWWVDESHRRTRAASMLFDAYTDYGRDHCQWVAFSLQHDSPVTNRSIERRGYRFKERHFLMEVA